MCDGHYKCLVMRCPLPLTAKTIHSNSLTSNIWHCRRWWWWASWACVWLDLGLARRLRTSSLWLKSSASDSSPSLTSHVSGHVGQARIHVSPSHRTQRPHKQTRGSDSFLTTPSHLSRGVFRWAVQCGVLRIVNIKSVNETGDSLTYDVCSAN